MKSITQAKQLAAALASEFGADDLHINVQMRRGENWVNLDMYQNSEEPERLLATLATFVALGDVGDVRRRSASERLQETFNLGPTDRLTNKRFSFFTFYAIL